MRAVKTPAPITARGKVRRGSLISSLIAETSSNPVKANAICDQKFTVSQLQCGIMFDTVKCVTEPCRDHNTPATPHKINKGIYVETPPAFCSHLPMFRP